MAGYPDPEGFSLERGLLRCPYDMNSVPPRELRSWCEKLLERSEQSLTVDLSGTRHIASLHLGILAEVWRRSLKAGKDLVLLISPDLRRIFELSGFDQVFNLVEKSEP